MALEISGQSSHSIIRISNTNLFLKIPKTSQGIPLSDPIKLSKVLINLQRSQFDYITGMHRNTN